MRPQGYVFPDNPADSQYKINLLDLYNFSENQLLALDGFPASMLGQCGFSRELGQIEEIDLLMLTDGEQVTLPAVSPGLETEFYAGENASRAVITARMKDGKVRRVSHMVIGTLLVRRVVAQYLAMERLLRAIKRDQ